MSERVMVPFTRAEFDAALAELRKSAPKQGLSAHGASGPTLYMADLQDAVRRMENADRHLKVVS